HPALLRRFPNALDAARDCQVGGPRSGRIVGEPGRLPDLASGELACAGVVDRHGTAAGRVLLVCLEKGSEGPACLIREKSPGSVKWIRNLRQGWCCGILFDRNQDNWFTACVIESNKRTGHQH